MRPAAKRLKPVGGQLVISLAAIREIHRLCVGAGLEIVSTTSRDYPLDFEDWMQRTDTPAHLRRRIRDRIDLDLDGDAATGLRPHRSDDGTITLTHPWSIVTASRRP